MKKNWDSQSDRDHSSLAHQEKKFLKILIYYIKIF